MTYVVGVVHGDEAAIIADMGITEGKAFRELAVKTGVLFPGCIYGICGDAAAARAFIEDRKRGLTTSSEQNWRDFLTYASQPRLSEPRFWLLLSTSCGQCPRLHVYDSHRGLRDEANLVTLGAGTAILDEGVRMLNATRVPVERARFSGFGALDTWPAVYCLWLTQHTLTTDPKLRGRLVSAGVGGLFHYVTLTDRGEMRQPPTTYLLVSREHSETQTRVLLEFYKIMCTDHAVIVEDGVEDALTVCMDWHSEPDLKLSDSEARNARMRAEVTRAPDGHRLCGIGFAEPALFAEMFFKFPTDVSQPVDFATVGVDVQEAIEDRLQLPRGALPLPVRDPDAGRSRRSFRSLTASQLEELPALVSQEMLGPIEAPLLPQVENGVFVGLGPVPKRGP